MNVKRVVPCGYCKGVIMAIKTALKTKEEYPDTPVCVLGELVHNRHVTQALEEKGIRSLSDRKSRLELLDEIEEGVVIFSAHGISSKVKEKAEEKGLICIDASCPDVLKTKDIILDYLDRDYEIFYIGVKNHPEAQGVIEESERIHLITNEEDIPDILAEKILVTNQTTMNIKEIQVLIDKILEKYPRAEVLEEICNATRMRQEAVRNLQDVDILYVIGDPHSNNTRNLAAIAPQSVKKVRLIESVMDVDESELDEDMNVAVTAGASTPTALTDQVMDYLENVWPEKPSEICQNIL